MQQPLCDRTTCQKSRVRGSHLCREHLAEAVHEAVLTASTGVPLRNAVLGFAAGIGTGIVSSGLWEIISDALESASRVMNLMTPDVMRRYEALTLASGALRQGRGPDELERALAALERMDGRDQSVILEKLIEALEEQAV